MRASKPNLSSPAEIVEAALARADSNSVATLDMFCEGMGSAAGNLALTYGAKGGIYIAGGVIPKFLNFFLSSNFRNKFEDKGRFVSYLKTIPVYIIKRENLGLLGAAKKLNEVIRA
jgi:glucokinase